MRHLWASLVRWRASLVRRLLSWNVKYYSLFLAMVVGLLCGIAAQLLKTAAHFTHSLVIDHLALGGGSLILLVLPGVGILLTVYFVRYLVRDDLGHGVTQVLLSISRRRSRLKVHHTFSSIVASSLTIGFGGSVGAEAPIVLTGSAIGSNVARLFGADLKTVTLMLGCGAAAGVAAVFKAPLAGMVFTLEVLLLDLTMGSIVPLLVAAASATTVAYLFQGDASLFEFDYSVAFDIARLPYYILLGIFTGFVSLYFMRASMGLEAWFARRRQQWVRIAIGSAALGLLLYFFPALYGEGYESVQSLFRGDSLSIFASSPLRHLMDSPWGIVACLGALILVKVVAMCATTGAGGVGGSFAPTLFVGAMSGYLLVMLLNMAGAGLGEANFVLVGMAGTMAGVMHAPLLGIFLIAELTQGYALLLPLMVTATVAYVTIVRFEPHSIYTKRLAADGKLITHHKDRAVLTMLQLSKVIETDLTCVRAEQSLGELVEAVAHSHRNIFPVVDEQNELKGIVLLDDIRTDMFVRELYYERTVSDYISLPPAIIRITDPMEEVMRKFEETQAWNLPVSSATGYVGFVSKAKIFSAYREMLVQFSDD